MALPVELRHVDSPWRSAHGITLCLAETEDDAIALIRETARQSPADIHRPLRPLSEGSLYRELLAAGCRNIKMMNLMALGPYESADGVWLPSVLY